MARMKQEWQGITIGAWCQQRVRQAKQHAEIAAAALLSGLVGGRVIENETNGLKLEDPRRTYRLQTAQSCACCTEEIS